MIQYLPFFVDGGGGGESELMAPREASTSISSTSLGAMSPKLLPFARIFSLVNYNEEMDKRA